MASPYVDDKQPLTEAEMMTFLRRRSLKNASTPTRSGDGTTSGPDNPGHSFLHHTPAPTPKMPLFSGDEPPQKGDVSFEEWRFEVNCLMNDDEVSPSQLVQAMRRSLRGTARKLLVPLGEKASAEDILNKLDVMFGDVSSKGMIMQEFFNATQRSSESVTSYGCRLETLLQTAVDHDHIPVSSKNDLLRHKFWTGLHSEKLKSQTRHKYDTVTDFNLLLRQIRQVEKELSLSSGSSKGAHHNPVNATPQDLEDRLQTFEKRIDTKVQSQLDTLEARLNKKLDDKFSTIISKLDSMSTNNQASASQSSSQQRQDNGKPKWKRRWRNKPTQGTDSTPHQPQQQQQASN